MIDFNRVNFAYADTISIAWYPVDSMNVKVAIIARNKNDQHNKKVARALLMERLNSSEDPRFVFYFREANARRNVNPNPNLLKYQTVLNACLHAHNMYGMPYARKFVLEASKPSQTFLNPPWFTVYQRHNESSKRANSQGSLVTSLDTKDQGPYTRDGLKIYFMHDVENRYSMGWTYNPQTRLVWFATAACHSNDAFNRAEARQTIKNRRGVVFSVRGAPGATIGYNDFLAMISHVVLKYSEGVIIHPDVQAELNRLPQRVIKQINNLPESIVERKIGKVFQNHR